MGGWWRFGRFGAVLVALALGGACSDGAVGPAANGTLDLTRSWETARPEDVGFDADALDAAVEAASAIERMRSLLVVRDGKLALERYWGGWDASTLADVRSVTKTVVSTLAGIAAADGDLVLGQSIGAYLRPPEFDIPVDFLGITVRDFLTMGSGIGWTEQGTLGYNDWIRSDDPVQYVFDRSLDHDPGTSFTYNSATVHLLGLVIEEATGEPLDRYAEEELFGPLGINRVEWEPLDGGVNAGSGIDLRPRDLARLGQLFLQDGVSGDERILPEGWAAEATSPRWDSFGSYGPMADYTYGYLWWLDLEHDAHLAWGYGGQFVYVAPALDLVVVANTDWVRLSQDIGSAALQEAVLRVVVEQIVEAAR